MKKKSNSGCLIALLSLTGIFVYNVYKYCLFKPLTWCITKIKNYSKTNKISNNIQDNHFETTQKQEKPILSVYFKVAGVTFENRQELIKKIVKSRLSDIFYKPYNGWSNKEIEEYGYIVYEANNVPLNKLRLEPTTFDGDDAIEIYETDDDNEILMGYVPKNKIKEVINFLKTYQDHPEYKLNATAYYTGGKYKEYDYDEEKINIGYDNYGINVKLELYK